jgi:hypothetical protein
LESEDLNERIEWEARRVAAAFEIQAMIPAWNGVKHHFLGKTPDGVSVTWEIKPPSTHWTRIRVHGGEEWSLIESSERGWYFAPNTGLYFDEVLAYGLFRLGFEDEKIWSELPPLSLSAHEKLELRLSLPREFWPKTWLDEEGESD